MRLSDKIASFIATQPHFGVLSVVFFMAGILAYFALPFEPPVIVPVILLIVILIGWIWVRKRLLVRYGFCFAFFFAFGFLNINLHGLMTHTVMPRHIMERVPITGTVTNSVLLRKGQMVELDITSVKGVPADKTPRHVRVSARFTKPELHKGMTINGLATLFPMNRPLRSLAPDMSLTAFYTGTAMSGVLHKAQIKSEPSRPTLGLLVEKTRTAIATRIGTVLPRETNGIVKALIIGEQRDILDHTRFLYRVSGIYHVLSVSGLHMSLIALFFFVIITRLLALSIWLDEKISTQKLAAILTLVVAFFYLLLSGAQVPAVRAFIMLSFVLGGVLLGRNALSVRAVALAALVILLISPHLILTASFQLSFAAVLILISVYQNITHWFTHKWKEIGFVLKAVTAVIGLAIASLLATVATLPAVAYHFHQFSPYGILGNLGASFLFSFGVMPLLVCAVLLMPFGWDAPFLKGAGFLLEQVNGICEYIATQPQSTIIIPAFYPWGLGVASLGVVLICLFYGWKSRLAGMVLIGVSLFAFIGVPKPDLMVGENGKLFAMRDKNGGLILSESYLNRFVSNMWLLMNNQSPTDYWLPKAFRPDEVEINGVRIGLSDKVCNRSDISLILGVKPSKTDFADCKTPVIRRTDFNWDGMHEIYVRDGRVHIEKPGLKDANRLWRTQTQ